MYASQMPEIVFLLCYAIDLSSSDCWDRLQHPHDPDWKYAEANRISMDLFHSRASVGIQCVEPKEQIQILSQHTDWKPGYSYLDNSETNTGKLSTGPPELQI